MSNQELLALSRRLRGKSSLVLDADMDFAHDLMMASFLLDDLLDGRRAIDAVLVGATLCMRP